MVFLKKNESMIFHLKWRKLIEMNDVILRNIEMQTLFKLRKLFCVASFEFVTIFKKKYFSTNFLFKIKLKGKHF